MNIVDQRAPTSIVRSVSTATASNTALNVLCVNDSEEDVLLIVEALRQGGHAVTFERVDDQRTLEAALERREWDIVICDTSLPKFAGMSALQIVKQHGRDIPFIIVSGAVLEESALAAIKTGAHDYVMKGELSRLAPAVGRELVQAGQRRAQRLAEVNLRSNEALLSSIINTAADAILVVDESGTIEFVNPAVERMVGWKPLELIGRNIEVLLVASQCASNLRTLMRPDFGTRPGLLGYRHELDARRKDGSVFSIETMTSAMRSGARLRYTCILRDITERKHTEERMLHLAHYDELTGLPNQALMLRLLDQAIAEAKHANTQVAVFCVDLDRFKLLSDALSQDARDRILRQVAQRVAAALSERDFAARCGADEFVLLMRSLRAAAEVERTAQALLGALAQPYTIDGQQYHLTASMGISTFPGDGQTGQGLLKNAATAMCRAKEYGNNSYQFHQPQMNAHSFERMALQHYLCDALEQNEFELHYQPKVDLFSGRISGMEALLRWMHPKMGMIAPAKFMLLAEETGLIVPLGAWVLKCACAQTSEWRRAGWKDLRVAVNLSRRQLAQDDLYATVIDALDEAGLPPEQLELEITESATLENPEHAIGLLTQLKSLGIRLAIDDFGTGYSSLGYLKRFPIDNVKIDRSFIKGIANDAEDAAITRAVIAMAHSLRLKVIAEGVESESHVAFLRQLGCDEAQGYWFGKAMPAREFGLFLQQRRNANLITLRAEPA